MDWEMALAITTMLATAGWLVFKVMVWTRENVERRKAALKAEEAKNEAARKAEEAKNEAAREEDRKWRVRMERKIDGIEMAAERRHMESEKWHLESEKWHTESEKRHTESERRHAASMAGIREAVDNNTRAIDRLFRLHDDHSKALMGIKADMAGFKSSLDNLYRLHKEGMEVHGRQIAALCDRMGTLERKVDGLERKVDGIERSLADLKDEFAAFREAVAPRAAPFGASP